MRPASIPLFLLLALPLMAQQGRNEIGLLVGAETIPSHSANAGKIDFGTSEAWQLTYARRLSERGPISWYFEAPFAVGPSHSVTSSLPVRSPLSSPITSLATLYFTPGFRLKLNSHGVLAPWIAAGGGYSLYEGSARLRNGSKNIDQHVSSGALQFGGGVDVKTPVRLVLPIALRAEFRDFYTLAPADLGVPTRDGSQHNYVASAGLVLRWGH